MSPKWEEELVDLQKAWDETNGEEHRRLVRAMREAIATTRPTEVFVLLEDGDRTTRSVPEPFGVAVTTEAEAKRYVEEGRDPSVYAYQRLRVYTDYDDAVRSVYGKLHDECKARRLSKP